MSARRLEHVLLAFLSLHALGISVKDLALGLTLAVVCHLLLETHRNDSPPLGSGSEVCAKGIDDVNIERRLFAATLRRVAKTADALATLIDPDGSR
jgi:hypothetical protein